MASSERTSIGPLPAGFKRLERNDTEQTNDQWKANLLKETGAVAPLWTAFARGNKRPVMTITRPHEPLKPSDPDIMAAMKEEYRSAIALQQGIDVAAVPTVSSLVVWKHYQAEKESYDDALEKFKIQFKEIHETFPHENRKVFSMVEKAMSEASVEDVKMAPRGTAAHEQQDALTFLNLAMDVHDFISPQISDRACQNAKLRFENLRQTASTPLSEHFAQFRRNLDQYSKVRGDDIRDIYKDFELKHYLLTSLHEPTWGSWIRTCQMTRTLPTTFEGLEAALREEEAARILSNLKDPYRDTVPMAAHATKASVTPTPCLCACSECGASFTPKRTVHHRCDACHKTFVSEKKKRRDQKGSNSQTPRQNARSAHETEASYATADEDRDGQPTWASYSTTVSALATSACDPDHIIFDPAANSHVIRDRCLALDINENGPITRIKGSVPGCIEVRTHGTLGDMGTGPVSASFSKNLVSESAALAAGYHVLHDTRVCNEYRLIKEGRPPLVFRANKDFMAHFPNSYEIPTYSTDVDRSQITFTKPQRDRADLYRKHHATTLAHAHDDRVIAALENGSLIDVPYTAADVRNSAVIHGPCPQCLQAKGTRHQQTGSYPRQPSAPGEFLAGDLFQIMGVFFYLVTCRLVNMRIVIRIKNKSASQIMSATSTALDIWKGFGASPKVISWDQEPAMVASAHEIWAKHGVRLDFTPPEGHEKVAERNVRTIKEHVYASILTLGHAIDDTMLEGLVRDTTTMLNFLPNINVDRSSPRTILDGERLNYKRWSRFSAGQVGEFEIPYPDHSKGTRRELGYILCHQGDNAVVRLLPSGKRTVVRSAHFTPLEKSTAIVQMIEAGIDAAQKQRYNDLIEDISEQLPHVPAHLQHDIPQPVTPIGTDHAARPPTPELTQEQDQHAPDLSGPPHTHPTVPPSDQDNTDVPSQTSTAEEISDIEFMVPTAVEILPLPTEPTVTSDHGIAPIAPSDPTPQTSPGPALRHSPGAAPRRSQRTNAKKPSGYYAKLHHARATTCESIRDYIACHMSARECANTYGIEAQEAAGAEEIINIIGREALIPRDYRTLTKEDMDKVLPSFIFYKAKELLPSEMEESDDGKLTWTTVISKRDRKKRKKKTHKIKGRWVGGGNHQKKSEALRDRVAPTARSTTHAIVITIAAKEKRLLHVGDIPSAYLQAKHVPADGSTTFIRADKETTAIIVKVYPDLVNYVTKSGTMILEVAKALYGLVESAWLWYQELARVLMEMGYEVTEADRGLFVKKISRNGSIIASNIVSVHVDDLISAASPNPEGERLSKEFWSTLESKWPGIKHQTGPRFKHLSWDIIQDPSTGSIRRSQASYIRDVLKTLKIDKFENYPMRGNLLTHKPEASLLSPAKHSEFRSNLQKVAYAREGRPDIDFVVAYLQRQQTAPTETDWSDLQHLLYYLNKEPEHWVMHEPSDLQLRAFVDSSYNLTSDGASHYGFLLTVGHSLVGLKGGRINTVVRSSTEAEIVGVNEVTSEVLWARDVLIELGFPQQDITIAEDNSSCISMMQTEPRNFQTNSRHVRVKWAFFRQENDKEILRLVHCPTEKMRADLLTKPLRGNVFKEHDTAILQGTRMSLSHVEGRVEFMRK